MKKAVIYCRVGTTNEDDRLSLEMQETTCRQYLEELTGYKVVEVVSDVQAVGNPDRVGISKLINMAAERQLNAICIDSKERFGSDSDSINLLIGDLEDLEAEVLFVNNVPDDSDDGRAGTTNATST